MVLQNIIQWSLKYYKTNHSTDRCWSEIFHLYVANILLMRIFAEFWYPFFHELGVGRKRCKIWTKQLITRCLPSFSFLSLFACLLLVCNYGIWKYSLRGRSSSKILHTNFIHLVTLDLNFGSQFWMRLFLMYLMYPNYYDYSSLLWCIVIIRNGKWFLTSKFI